MKVKVPGALGVPVQLCWGFRDIATGPARAMSASGSQCTQLVMTTMRSQKQTC